MSLDPFVFIIAEPEKRYPGGWLIAPRGKGCGNGEVIDILQGLGCPLTPRQRERLKNTESLVGLFKNFSLKGIRLDSHMGMLGWLEGKYSLEVRNDIPKPEEMLEAQVQGRRYLSLLNKPNEKYRAIGRHAGAFEFLLHDFEHAHKFFGDPFLFRGQISFFRFLKAKMSYFDRWIDDPLFMKDLHYLMSDMNSHPVHLFKYLKAIVLTAELRRQREANEELDAFWLEVLQSWPVEHLESALRINRPEIETESDRIAIARHFDLDASLTSKGSRGNLNHATRN